MKEDYIAFGKEDDNYNGYRNGTIVYIGRKSFIGIILEDLGDNRYAVYIEGIGYRVCHWGELHHVLKATYVKDALSKYEIWLKERGYSVSKLDSCHPVFDVDNSSNVNELKAMKFLIDCGYSVTKETKSNLT